MLRIALVAALFAGLPAREVVAQDKLTVKFKGKTADQWAALLVDTDFDTSMLAAQALGSIGAEALPFIPPAFKSTTVFVHINAVAAVNEPAVAMDRAGAFKVLALAFKSQFPEVRQTALAQCVRHKAIELLPELRAMVAAERVEPTLRAMRPMLAELEALAKKAKAT